MKRFRFFLFLFFCGSLAAETSEPLTWCCTNYQYDSLGRLSKVSYNTENILVRRIVFTYAGARKNPDHIYWYDEAGTMLKKKQLYYNASDSLVKVIVVFLADYQNFPPGQLPSFDPEEKQKPIRLYATARSKPDTTFLFYERDQTGLLVKDSVSSTWYHDKTVTFYTYDNGRLVCRKNVIAGGASYTTIYTYDNAGHLAETSFSQNGIPGVISKNTYSYRDDGKLEFEKHINDPDHPSLPPEVSEYCYNKAGQLVKIRIRLNRRWRNKVTLETFTWSPNGKLAGHCFYADAYDELD